jgi:hypothetical protein
MTEGRASGSQKGKGAKRFAAKLSLLVQELAYRRKTLLGSAVDSSQKRPSGGMAEADVMIDDFLPAVVERSFELPAFRIVVRKNQPKNLLRPHRVGMPKL